MKQSYFVAQSGLRVTGVRYKFGMSAYEIAEMLTRPELAPLMWARFLDPPPPKRCVMCKLKKALACFNRKKRSKDGLQPACRSCNKTASRDYYERNRLDHIDEVRRQMERRRKVARLIVLAHLVHNPCVDCGERDPVVLDFDHVKGIKRSAVGDLVGRGYSLKAVRREMAKCEVRCANCHRRRTARQFGWWKYRVTRSLSKLGYFE